LLSQLTLRCIIYSPATGVYIAECIDLDILVTGKDQNEASRKLIDAMKGYLKVVLAGDPKGLIPRRAPLSHRIRYRWFAARAAIINGTHRTFRLFDLPADSTCLCGI
jgi:hypothetical protein